MKFGELLNKYRMRKKLTLRGFARELDVSPVYIMDIEKGRRGAPRREIIDKMVAILELKEEEEIRQFYDKAAETKKEDFVPGDVKIVFKQIENAVLLMRTIKKKNLTKKNVEELIKDIEKGKYGSGE